MAAKVRNIRSDLGAPMVHAATLAYYGGRELLAFFSGVSEGQLTKIEVFTDGAPLCTLAVDGLPSWNPVWGGYARGVARLFWKSGYRCSGWNGMVSYIDFNRKRVFHYTLPAGWVGPARTSPVETRGVMYCGSSTEAALRWASYMEIYWFQQTEVKGTVLDMVLPVSRTAIARPAVEALKPSMEGRSGLIQPALLEKDGMVHMFMRSTADIGCVAYSNTLRMQKDLDVQLMQDLKAPNSGLDVVEEKGTVWAVHNAPVPPGAQGSRKELLLTEIIMPVEPDGDAVTGSSRLLVSGELEVSYPCFARRDDGQLMLAYTDERRSIAIMEVDT